jgi:hypothetical protein
VSDGELAHEEPYRVLLRLLVQRDPALPAQLLRKAGYLVEPPEAGDPEPVDVQLSEGAAVDVLDLWLNMLDEADGREPRGHPDPDDVAYQESVGVRGVGLHSCDGCCRRP